MNGFYGEFSIKNEYIITQVDNDVKRDFSFHIGDKVNSIDDRDIRILSYDQIVQILSSTSVQNELSITVSPERVIREEKVEKAKSLEAALKVALEWSNEKQILDEKKAIELQLRIEHCDALLQTVNVKQVLSRFLKCIMIKSRYKTHRRLYLLRVKQCKRGRVVAETCCRLKIKLNPPSHHKRKRRGAKQCSRCGIRTKQRLTSSKESRLLQRDITDWDEFIMTEIIDIETSVTFKTMGSIGGITPDLTEYESTIIVEADKIFTALEQSRLKGSGANNAGDGPTVSQEEIDFSEAIIRSNKDKKDSQDGIDRSKKIHPRPNYEGYIDTTVILPPGTTFIPATPNGNCLYQCFQMYLKGGSKLTPIQMRFKICDYILVNRDNPMYKSITNDQFIPTYEKFIIEEQNEGGLNLESYINGMKFDKNNQYSIKYGGEPELHAFSSLFDVYIETYILKEDGSLHSERFIDCTKGNNCKKTIRLHFVNGNHYDLINISHEQDLSLSQSSFDLRAKSNQNINVEGTESGSEGDFCVYIIHFCKYFYIELVLLTFADLNTNNCQYNNTEPENVCETSSSGATENQIHQNDISLGNINL